MKKSILSIFTLILASHSTFAAAGETCGEAISITSLDCSAPASYDVGALSTNIALPSCGNSSNAGDSWYSFVSDGTDAVINVDNAANGGDVSVAIYSGCTAGELIQCTNDDSGALSTNDESMSVSSLVDGQTYYVRVMSQEKANGNPKYYGNGTICIDQTPYTLGGSATTMTGNPGCVQLTTETTGQTGCAWNDSEFDFTQDFDYEFTVNLGDQDANGADGLAFVINGSGSTSCGDPGGGIGSGGITPSLIIEFDTWQNGAGEAENLPWEPVCDHIAVETDGILISDGTGNSAPYAGPVQADASDCNIEDGADHTIRITYDASAGTFEIYFDGVSRLTFNIDLAAFFGTNSAPWGFTSSTGGFTNNQSFCPGNLPGNSLGFHTMNYDVSCENNNAKLDWSTDNEEDMDYYIIEQTLDGQFFSTVKTILANNTSSNHYSFTDNSYNSEDSYYRIKAFDTHGNLVMTSSVLSSDCDLTNENNIKISESDKNISVGFNSKYKQMYSVKIHDIRGKLVWETTSQSEKGNNQLNVDLSSFSSSVYILNYVDEQTAISKKFVLR